MKELNVDFAKLDQSLERLRLKNTLPARENPLWANDLAVVSPHVAARAAEVMGWLEWNADQMSSANALASVNHQDPLQDYQQLADELAQLQEKSIKEGEKKGFWEGISLSWNKKQPSSLIKMEELLKQRKALSEGARRRLNGLREGLDVRLELTLSCALLAEFLPPLYEKIQAEKTQSDQLLSELKDGQDFARYQEVMLTNRSLTRGFDALVSLQSRIHNEMHVGTVNAEMMERALDEEQSAQNQLEFNLEESIAQLAALQGVNTSRQSQSAAQQWTKTLIEQRSEGGLIRGLGLEKSSQAPKKSWFSPKKETRPSYWYLFTEQEQKEFQDLMWLKPAGPGEVDRFSISLPMQRKVIAHIAPDTLLENGETVYQRLEFLLDLPLGHKKLPEGVEEKMREVQMGYLIKHPHLITPQNSKKIWSYLVEKHNPLLLMSDQINPEMANKTNRDCFFLNQVAWKNMMDCARLFPDQAIISAKDADKQAHFLGHMFMYYNVKGLQGEWRGGHYAFSYWAEECRQLMSQWDCSKKTESLYMVMAKQSFAWSDAFDEWTKKEPLSPWDAYRYLTHLVKAQVSCHTVSEAIKKINTNQWNTRDQEEEGLDLTNVAKNQLFDHLADYENIKELWPTLMNSFLKDEMMARPDFKMLNTLIECNKRQAQLPWKITQELIENGQLNWLVKYKFTKLYFEVPPELKINPLNELLKSTPNWGVKESQIFSNLSGFNRLKDEEGLTAFDVVLNQSPQQVSQYLAFGKVDRSKFKEIVHCLKDSKASFIQEELSRVMEWANPQTQSLSWEDWAMMAGVISSQGKEPTSIHPLQASFGQWSADRKANYSPPIDASLEKMEKIFFKHHFDLYNHDKGQFLKPNVQLLTEIAAHIIPHINKKEYQESVLQKWEVLHDEEEKNNNDILKKTSKETINFQKNLELRRQEIIHNVRRLNM